MSTIAPSPTAPAADLAENENRDTSATEAPVITPPPTIVTVDTLSLQAALAKYTKLVTNKNGRLIVQGIRISAAEHHLDLLGTDLEIALYVTIPANALTTPSNAIVADYRALLNAVKAVRDRQTQLALYGDYLIVSDSASSTHISSFGEVGDFPQPPRRVTLQECLATREANAPAYQKQNTAEFEKMKHSWRETLPLEFQEFAVSAASLSPALIYVLPGMADGDTRYALNGVFMAGNGRGGAEFVTSNTHVLYKHDATLTGGTLPDNAGFTMLPKAAEWLAKNACGTITVKTDPNTVFFEGDGFTLTGRRIEGMFPRYRDVIPAQSSMPGRLTVSRKEFLAALKAARPNIHSDTRRIDLVPHAEGHGLIIRAMCGNTTTFTAEIPAASRKWLTASFNVDFLIDFLAVHLGDAVTICRDGAAEEGSGPSAVYDGERLFLAMPLNNARETTPEEREAYRAYLAEPDQEFPVASILAAKTAKKVPAFKAVVKRALADVEYKRTLLEALGMLHTVA